MPIFHKPKTQWLGKVAGHVKQAKAAFKRDADERQAAERLPAAQNIILTDDQIRNSFDGEWSAGRVLMTTLGGEARVLTANDLKAFQRNMQEALHAQGKAKVKTRGLTARQIINLAGGGRKKRYSPFGPSRQAGYDSDIDKAKREITNAIPVSMVNGRIRFLTPAGKDSKHTRHTVVIELLGWSAAMSQLASVDVRDEAAVRRIANQLRHAPIAYDCDCERHRYFFRYVATLGGFNAGRPEHGFPKITNPGLRGVACKHVLRAVTELESSSTVLKFLTKHLMAVRDARARSQLAQAAAEVAAQAKKTPTKIRTSDERKALAEKARIRRAALKAHIEGKKKKTIKPPKRRTLQTRKASKSEIAMRDAMRMSGVPEKQIKDTLENLRKQGFFKD